MKLINEENFLSGGDDGKLSVWGCLKKKPLCSYPEAHGKNPENGLPNWISSIATLLNTDLVASGKFIQKIEKNKEKEPVRLSFFLLFNYLKTNKWNIIIQE